MIPQYIPDIFAGVVNQVSIAMQARTVNPFPVYFDFGHYKEVLRQMEWKDQSVTMKEQKFPMIWLVMDFDESMGENPANYAKISTINFLLMNSTKPEWTMAERRDNNYLPILYPMLAEFIKQISLSVELGMRPEAQLKYTKTDRPYWGLELGGSNEKNFFNDYLDAIQLRNMNLNIVNKLC